MAESVSPNDRYIVKNIGTARISLHPHDMRSYPLVELSPGEEKDMSAHEAATVYSKAISSRSRDFDITRKSAKGLPSVKLDEKPAVAQDELVDDEVKAEAPVVAEVAEIKQEIKTLEKEYKSEETALARRQEIKEEIRVKKMALKSLK